MYYHYSPVNGTHSHYNTAYTITMYKGNIQSYNSRESN